MKFASLAVLFAHVNDLNVRAIARETGNMFWTAIFLDTRFIYKRSEDGIVTVKDVCHIGTSKNG